MNDKEQFNRWHFAETLTSLRHYAGLSQKELARHAGVPLSTVARLEQGRAAPSDAIRAKLEKAIGCPLYYGDHEQVRIKVGDREAEVDIGIAPLIRELWIAGIYTFMSCQQTFLGRIWIEFPDLRDCQNFLNIVAQYKVDKDSLYWRINVQGEVDPIV
jgi:transcriptional regulator with XRE-family HTH domain